MGHKCSSRDDCNLWVASLLPRVYKARHKFYRSQNSGTFVHGNHVDQPCTISGNAELVLPFEELHHVNLDYKNSFLIEENKIDLEGSTTLTYNKDKTVKIEGAFKSSGNNDGEHPYESDLKFDVTVLKAPPLSLHDHFKLVPNDDKVTVTTNTIVKYDQKELTLAIDSLTYDRDLTHIDAKAKVTTSYEKLRHIDLELKHEVMLLIL